MAIEGKTVSQLSSGNPAQSADLLYADRAGANFSLTTQSVAELPPQTPVSLGFLFAPYQPTGNTGTVQFSGGTINAVWGNKFVVPFGSQINVKKIIWRNAIAGAAGSKGAFAIYSAAGNKLIDSGAQAVDVANTLHTTVLTSPVLLTPGVYYVMMTCTDNTCTANGISAVVNGLWVDSDFPINVIATNVAVAGVMPATLGTLALFGSSPASCVLLGQ